MRRTTILATVLILAFALLGLAQPAAPGGGEKSLLGRNLLGFDVEPAMYSKDRLSKNLVVQKSLKITPEHLAKIAKGQADLEFLLAPTVKWNEYRRKPQEQIDPQVLASLEEARTSSMRQYDEKIEALFAKVLEKKTYIRLDQAQLQAQGPNAFLRKDVQERLSLSETQIAAITEIVQQGLPKIRIASYAPQEVLPPEARLPPGVDRKAVTPEERRAHLESRSVKAVIDNRREAVRRVRLGVMQEITRQLVRKQRNTYQAMLGEPFDFNKRDDEPKPASQAPKREPEPSSP